MSQNVLINLSLFIIGYKILRSTNKVVFNLWTFSESYCLVYRLFPNTNILELKNWEIIRLYILRFDISTDLNNIIN